MAVQKVILQPFNSVNLAAGTQYNLVSPGPGHYYFAMVNTGAGNVAISNANTVALTDPASFLLPPNVNFSQLAWGPTGIWVAGAAELSVALEPRQG